MPVFIICQSKVFNLLNQESSSFLFSLSSWNSLKIEECLCEGSYDYNCNWRIFWFEVIPWFSLASLGVLILTVIMSLTLMHPCLSSLCGLCKHRPCTWGIRRRVFAFPPSCWLSLHWHQCPPSSALSSIHWLFQLPVRPVP